MATYKHARKINGADIDGIIDIESMKVLCLCASITEANFIIGAIELAEKAGILITNEDWQTKFKSWNTP